MRTRKFLLGGLCQLGLIGVGLLLASCGSQPDDKPAAEASTPDDVADGSASAAAPATAQELLDGMARAYAQTDGYADRGELHMQFVSQGEARHEGPVPFSLMFERPGKLRMTAFEGEIFGDGTVMHASVASLPDQVLQLPAPSRLSRQSLPTDIYLNHALTMGIAQLVSPVLDLLTGISLPQPKEPPVLLEEETVDGQRCARVEVTGTDGKRVYWIDPQSYVLRRIDFPTDEISKTLDPSGSIGEVSIWADFVGASLEPKFDPNTFRYEVPATAKRLRRFVPPVMNPVPKSVGETIKDFSFVNLAGGTLNLAEVEDKIVVLDFWFTECKPCRASMPYMETIYQKFKSNDQVRFFAVSIDAPAILDAHIEKTLKQWGGTMPVVRDTQQQAEPIFQVSGAPTVVLLKNGRVEAFHAGTASPEELTSEIEQLLQGIDLAKKSMEIFEAERKVYERELIAAAADQDSQWIEVPKAVIAPRGAPARLKLTELWSCSELKKPGNIVAIPGADGEVRLFALDGFRTVVELSAQGKVLARHELPIPTWAAVSFLRTAVDKNGKRYFVLSAVTQQQCYLFDADWKLLLSFPDEDKHDGIADVQLADLANDGELELLVGYWGTVGVQAVSLTGNRLWTNRSMENVFQLALSDPDETGKRRILCVNTRGTLVPVDHQGEHQADLRVAGQALMNLRSADLDGDGKLEFCALAADPVQVDRMVLVGLNAKADKLWEYELPRGHASTPIERIVPVYLGDGDGGWILPAADGSVHLLTKDGQLVDKFNSGVALTGLCLFKDGTRQVLVLASEAGLVAFAVE